MLGRYDGNNSVMPKQLAQILAHTFSKYSLVS